MKKLILTSIFLGVSPLAGNTKAPSEIMNTLKGNKDSSGKPKTGQDCSWIPSDTCLTFDVIDAISRYCKVNTIPTNCMNVYAMTVNANARESTPNQDSKKNEALFDVLMSRLTLSPGPESCSKAMEFCKAQKGKKIDYNRLEKGLEKARCDESVTDACETFAFEDAQ